MSRRFIASLSVLFGAGCGSPDAGFTKLAEPEPPVEDTSVPPTEPVFEEVIPDTPQTCPERIFSAQPFTLREDCQTEPPSNRYEPVVEWQIGSFDEYPAQYDHNTTPVVGQLTDDDGDGRITSADVPDVLVISFWMSNIPMPLRLISGDGSAVHWSRDHWMVDDLRLEPITGGSPALGDVDADGIPEIAILLGPGEDYTEGSAIRDPYRQRGGRGCYVALLRPDGEILQINLEEPTICKAHQIALADVQMDGETDIIVGNEVFRSSDLARIAQPYNVDTTRPGYGGAVDYWAGGAPVVADLDNDGFMELITGHHIQEWDGEQRCRTGRPDAWPAVADLDGDGDGEIVVSGQGEVLVLDHQCRPIKAWVLDADGRGGPPTIADYDGDGVPEIGFAAADRYVVYETDGTLKWSSPANDYSSNCTGSSVFDFEEDGYAEVVYADETSLWVFSGHDGSFVMRWEGHASWTANEYPIVVDVDGDDEAEILVVGEEGVAAIGAVEGWAPARQVWNQHAYWITNVNDDLTIPSPTPQNWPEYNSFRSGDLRVNAGQGARLVDAVPFVHDICEVECDAGLVRVALSPANQGLADAIDGISLAIYAEQSDGSRSLLEVLTAGSLVRSAYTTEGVVLELAMSDLPTGTLILVADDDGTGTGVIEECDETNNELRLEGLCADE